MKKVVVVIPAYEPSSALNTLAQSLIEQEHIDLCVVNDGSSTDCHALFQQLRALPRTSVLHFDENMGKGHALKAAFEQIIQQTPQHYAGVVTADADGQHALADILCLCDHIRREPSTLWLGTRQFSPDIPWRSRFGNQLTLKLFNLCFQQNLHDTQTGLRGIPITFLPQLLSIKSNGYEFEFDMLICALQRQCVIKEQPIASIYIDGNKSSHFNPLIDSIKIYFVFVRFFSLSLLTSLIDFCIFLLCFSLTNQLLTSTYIGRLFAGIFNFSCAKRYVFRSRKSILSEVMQYVSLVALLALLAYGLIDTLVHTFGINVYISKVIAESALFLLSFTLQRTIIFATPPASKVTDWDAYYRKPTKTASMTRKVTEKKLLALLAQYGDMSQKNELCELGGANSCFYNGIRAHYPELHYTVIDNNTTGLDKFKHRLPEDANVTLIESNILAKTSAERCADVVFSVGLIEHFTPQQTAQAIKTHFIHARPDALVIITFPTPTFLYRCIRKIAEITHCWLFHDERPLAVERVVSEVSRYGDVVSCFINWRVLLTQGVVAVRAKKVGEAAKTICTGEV